MKLIKPIIKISVLWALISVTSGLLRTVFTADEIVFQVFAGVCSIALITGIILIFCSFMPRKKRSFTAFGANSGCRPTANQQQWAMDHAGQERKRSNTGLFGLFIFMISVFALGRTLRDIK
ncbi:MAG: hypothetical protein LBP63_08295 [Prevotellaceae bacterium]|jgi:hypothetical protein|nr:hypothetical protein [Prevotellaceae bacterium]